MLKEKRFVENFIDSIDFKSAESKRLAKVLLKSEEECNYFYIGFLGRNRYIIDDLLDYREKKLSKSNITLDKFIAMCDNSVSREAFEQTFLQPINSTDAELIEDAISKGKTSLKGIYNRFQSNVNENVLKNVL